MNKWVIRSLLLVLLVASVNLRAFVRTAHEPGADTETAVKELLAGYGFSYRETRSFPDGVLKSLVFDAPSCGDPIQVAVSPRTADASTDYNRLGAPGDVRLFAYLSKISEQEARFSFFVEHLKHSALGLIAMTPYRPDGMMLTISEPRGCKNLPPVPWSRVWEADYRVGVARELKQSSR